MLDAISDQRFQPAVVHFDGDLDGHLAAREPQELAERLIQVQLIGSAIEIQLHDFVRFQMRRRQGGLGVHEFGHEQREKAERADGPSAHSADRRDKMRMAAGSASSHPRAHGNTLRCGCRFRADAGGHPMSLKIIARPRGVHANQPILASHRGSGIGELLRAGLEGTEQQG